MEIITPTGYQNILKTIRSWPTVIRINLVKDVLTTVETDVTSSASPVNTLDKALGLLKSDLSDLSLTDEDVERILEEERIKKYV